MTINEAYLVALRATATCNYIPVMTHGLYDTFPGTPDTFPGHIGPFSWTSFHGYIDNLTLGQGVKYQYFH